MNTLYLHIGIPKTGTSAIQAFLCDNFEYLRKKGIYYPAKGSDLENILTLLKEESSKKEKNSSIVKQNISRRFLKYRLSTGNAGLLSLFNGDDVYKYFAIVSSKALSEKCDILLSSELLYSIPGKVTYFEQLKKLPFNIKVIVYLRRQDERFSSLINQLVKSGKKIQTINYPDCLKDPDINRMFDLLDYFNELEKIAKVIGRENIIVRRYYKGIDIIPDFLSIFNITLDENNIMPSGPINPSLSKTCLKIMYFVNKIVRDDTIRRLISSFLLDFSVKFSKSSSSAFLWDESVRQEILDKYEESNNKLAQLYLGEDKLFDR